MSEQANGIHTDIFGFMVFKEPVEKYFAYACSHGFKHLEIDLTRKHSLVKSFTPERIKNIREYCERFGIQLSFHPPYYINFSTWFPLKRKANLSILKESIRLAQRLRARHITVHMGSFSRSVLWASQRHMALDRVVKGFADVLHLCEDSNVFLALENVIPLRPESGFFFLGDSIEDLKYVFSRLDSPYLKWCLDTGHANCSQGVVNYIEQLGEHLLTIHVHDNHGEFDEHLAVGEGTIPWEKMLEALRHIDFHGPFVIESFKSLPHITKENLVLLGAGLQNNTGSGTF